MANSDHKCNQGVCGEQDSKTSLKMSLECTLCITPRTVNMLDATPMTRSRYMAYLPLRNGDDLEGPDLVTCAL